MPTPPGRENSPSIVQKILSTISTDRSRDSEDDFVVGKHDRIIDLARTIGAVKENMLCRKHSIMSTFLIGKDGSKQVL